MNADQKRRVAERLAEIERLNPIYAAPFRAAYAAKPGRKAAVKAKCLDCACWQMREITHCTVVTCPLWQIRPYQARVKRDPCDLRRQNSAAQRGNLFGRHNVAPPP